MTLSRRHLLNGALAAPLVAAATSLPKSAKAEETAQSEGAFHRFKVGDATVTALLDGHIALGKQIIAGFDENKAAAAMSGTLYRFKDEALQVPVSGYLVERAGKLTLIDSGTAQLMGPGLGGLGAALKSAGVKAEDISTVLLTHMHPDHTGGLIDGAGQAVFSNAELVVSATEHGFWYDDAILASVPEENRPFFQMARDTTAPYAGRLKLFEGEAEVTPGLTAVPLPGHTPGHSGFMLDGGSEGVLFWGDVIHLTALQFAQPEWTIAFDADPETTVKTRRAMLDRAASDRLLVTGAHLDFPGLGQVSRSKDAYEYVSAPWQFGQG
ncbi:MBL fold metallo-hydrolase [Epibacterium ulvae]|uniref:MBL fold metallo-hydrolase n=1 Tax=Epibacterium ulvae TaxID=1156985 RepID=UPI002491D5A3|nr:MBL fold metallo-hydrolase [Epibacterium ulvae]